MERSLLVEALLARGFVRTQNSMIFAGVEDGYAMQVLVQNFSKVKTVIAYIHVENAPGTQRMKAAKQAVAAYAKIRYPANGKSIVCELRDGKDGDIIAKWANMPAILEALRQNDILAPERCAICKDVAPESFMCMDAKYQPVHESCAREKHESLSEQAEEMPGSYVLGIIGALAGAIVGSLPSLLTILFADMVSGWLFALIPICAYYGYKIFKGKMDKFAIVFTIAFSVIGSLVMIFLANCFDLAGEWRIPFSSAVSFVIEILNEENLWLQVFFVDSVMVWVFLGFGIAVAWRIISQTTASAFKQSSFSLETLRPRENNAHE